MHPTPVRRQTIPYLLLILALFAVLTAFGISAGIGVLFGYLPAKKAARLNPIDALHYD